MFIDVKTFVLLFSRMWLLKPLEHNSQYSDASFYFSGFGCNFMFTNGLVTNTLNFTILRRGRVVGLLSAFFWAGSSVFSAIYGGLFDTIPNEVGNLKGYFLTVAVIFGLTSLLAIFAMRQYPITHHIEEYLKQYQRDHSDISDQDDSDKAPPLEKTSLLSSRAKRGSEVPKLSFGDISFFSLWTNMEFHLLFWPCVFCNGIQTAVIFNMSTYFESFSLMDYIGRQNLIMFPLGIFHSAELLFCRSSEQNGADPYR